MAIKITRTGIIPGFRDMVGECRNCDTAIECLESDAKELDPKLKDHKSVPCPVCGKTITVRLKGEHDFRNDRHAADPWRRY